jgi:hypothetical protein
MGRKELVFGQVEKAVAKQAKLAAEAAKKAAQAEAKAAEQAAMMRAKDAIQARLAQIDPTLSKDKLESRALRLAQASVDPNKHSDAEMRLMSNFGSKQEREDLLAKKVADAEKAGAKPAAESKPSKATGNRAAVPPDVFRNMVEQIGEEAALKFFREGKHLKRDPQGGYIGGPRTVTSPQGLGAMRTGMDSDLADAAQAVKLADPERFGTWYDRAKAGIQQSNEPYQLPGSLLRHSEFSAGVAPVAELGFSLKDLNSRLYDRQNPVLAYRGRQMNKLSDYERDPTIFAQALDESPFMRGEITGDKPVEQGFKVGEYKLKNDPRVPNTGLFGVNDFRRAQGMGFTDPSGAPWRAGVSETMHPFMDAETALQVDRANRSGLGGKTNWGGPHIQEVPWVMDKAQDFYYRGNKGSGQYVGDPLTNMKQALIDANNTTQDYFFQHAGSATHEAIPGASTRHVPGMLNATPEEKKRYSLTGRWDVAPPEDENKAPIDSIYSALGFRQLPSTPSSGYYVNSEGVPEGNYMTIARPLLDFPTGGGGGRISPETRDVVELAERFRAINDAQEAGALNLPNTSASLKGKNAVVLDTRHLNPNRLADPAAGVQPTPEQIAEINNIIGGGGFGATATNRGALIFPFDPSTESSALKELLKEKEGALQQAYPSRMDRGVASTSYVPGIGRMTDEGVVATAPYSGEATMGFLENAARLPQQVSFNLGESPSVRRAISEKMKRDAAMEGARGDIQETRRFFSEADWPKAVRLVREGMAPAAALAALGYSASSMAGEEP